MGVFWSSPYRLQVLVICLGLLLLTAAFVFLLLSIGLGDFHWRLVGGVCASSGSALLVIGSCWCVWVVRRGRFTHDGRLTVGVANPESEAQTLTSDAAWREEAGLDGPCLEAGQNDLDDEYDDDDDSDDDDDDDDDDMEEEKPPSGEEEEEDSFGTEVCPVDKRYRSADLPRTVAPNHEGFDDPAALETKEEEASRLIPV